ncbi:MAG: Fic family protein [Aeromicrobium sp.]|uniref:Fic/DOC family protein n=1 Tax=Aeromicrobium sp. TaxID=1871063 RepID=UPI0039E6F040
MTKFDTWESYFYPETYDGVAGVFRNQPGFKSAIELRVYEYQRVAARTAELASGRVQIPRTFDARHLRAIHRHLFQDVYEWAGEYRSVPMRKRPHVNSPVVSNFASPANISRYLADTRRFVVSQRWATMTPDQFAGAAAHTYAYLNTAHAFREGNGRAMKMFLNQVSELSPYRIEFDELKSEVIAPAWNDLSARSTPPDRDTYEPRPVALEGMFRHMTRPAEEGPTWALNPESPDEPAQLLKAPSPEPTPGLTNDVNDVTQALGAGIGRAEDVPPEQTPEVDLSPDVELPDPQGYER